MLATNPDPQVASQLATNALPALFGLVQKLTASLRDASQPDLANQLDQSVNEITALGTDIHDTSNSADKEIRRSGLAEARPWPSCARCLSARAEYLFRRSDSEFLM
ncbi:MAG TPA: hypothetical protein VGK22_14635 [Candidatus Angelobacter sp.]|jgi:hypothetical protein